MYGPAEHQQRAAIMHNLPLRAYAPAAPYYHGQQQQQIPYALYQQPSYPLFQPQPHESFYTTAYSPRGYLPTKQPGYLEDSWGLSHTAQYGAPPLQHGSTMSLPPVPSERKKQHVAPIITSPLPSSARGPPSKPRQSGWAVWVGNLPQDTTVIHMRDYFSSGARADIDSVFLIKKTNCAFINYKTEKACLDAIQRFNNSLFRGHRLVCRIRRSSSDRSVAESTPSESDVLSLSESSSPRSSLDTPSDLDNNTPLIVCSDDRAAREVHSKADLQEELMEPLVGLKTLDVNPKVKTRVFILKSLTLQDLFVSARDGTWATQPHNEEKLNEAFLSSEDVYLVFSANKSGQYFGYARMESPISNDKSPTSTKAPASPTAQRSDHDTPQDEMRRTIPTPATATAPEGHIIDDSARGTIFWEAGRIDSEDCQASGEKVNGSTEGRQFALRWISTTQVPFHATRGLRNPLNSNREVKIAKDGTELGAYAGSRLLQLFHRGTSPTSPTSRWS